MINFTHITFLQLAGIVVSSGVVVALINQAGAWMVGHLHTRSQERMQKNDQAFNERLHRDERENQSLQLLITAHFDQRERSLKDAVDVWGWLRHEYSTLYGADTDYYGVHDPPTNISTVAEVLSALDRVSYFHPTRSVRSLANKLESSIADQFNTVNDRMDGVGDDPSREQLSKWMRSANELIELIHTPPSLDEVRHTDYEVDIQLSMSHSGKALQRIRKHFTKSPTPPEVFEDL